MLDNKCPFARFLPLGWVSCEGAGNGHVFTCYVFFNVFYMFLHVFTCFYMFLLLWSILDFVPFGLILLYFEFKCVDFSRWKFLGKGRTYAGKGWKYLGRFIMTQKWKHEVVSFFLEMVFLWKWLMTWPFWHFVKEGSPRQWQTMPTHCYLASLPVYLKEGEMSPSSKLFFLVLGCVAASLHPCLFTK